MGFFGNLFDFNGDGKLDTWEKAADFSMFMNMLESEKESSLTASDFNSDEDNEY